MIKRLPVYVVLLVVLGMVVLAGGMVSSTGGDATSDPATISDYQADFTVDADGDLHARETITVDFPLFASRHGIYRFFDHRDPNAAFARRTPEDISVTRDGQQEEFELLSEGHGRYTNVKIGSAYRTLSGSHVYVIDYTMTDALLEADGGKRSRFYWDLIPAGWQMPITKATLTVHLPADAEDVNCHLGAGKVGGCTAAGSGTDTLTVTTDRLNDHTPVTISTEVDVPTPKAKDRHPWPVVLDGILGSKVAGAALALLLGLLAALLGLKVSRSTREKSPSFPVLYAPPEGIGPAQAAYLLREKVDTQQYVATLMHAAEQGQVSFQPDGAEWRVGPAEGEPSGHLDEVTSAVIDSLGARNKTFVASPSSVKAGKRLKSSLESFEGGTRNWAQRNSLMQASGLGGGGAFLVIGSFVVAGLLAFAQPLPGSIWAIVPGLFGIFGYETALTGAGTRRTPQGRELWSRIGGFHRILSTPSAEARFDFAARKDLYTAYLPWAVAFGCADEWAQKYRIEVGQEPPAPRYWGSYNGAHTGIFVSQMVQSFDSTVGSAISSYQATQRSSSGGGGGGGGGGFGGGGGGGGGGGSW